MGVASVLLLGTFHKLFDGLFGGVFRLRHKLRLELPKKRFTYRGKAYLGVVTALVVKIVALTVRGVPRVLGILRSADVVRVLLVAATWIGPLISIK
jgi:hypothetical protein